MKYCIARSLILQTNMLLISILEDSSLLSFMVSKNNVPFGKQGLTFAEQNCCIFDDTFAVIKTLAVQPFLSWICISLFNLFLLVLSDFLWKRLYVQVSIS